MTENIPEYQDYLPMMMRVLGREHVSEGEGILPFLRACQTYEESKGTKFSTWLWECLVNHKRDLLRSIIPNNVPYEEGLTELEKRDYMYPSVEAEYERRDTFIKNVLGLSPDARKLVMEVLDRTLITEEESLKYLPPITAGRRALRKELSNYFIHEKGWKQYRYDQAVSDVTEMLKELR